MTSEAIEIDLKESKQGLGISKRNKKSYTGKQMVMLLVTLAHNVMVWAKRWLEAGVSKIKKYEVKRMVKDVFSVSGFIEIDQASEIKRVVINKVAPLARLRTKCLQGLQRQEHVAVI